MKSEAFNYSDGADHFIGHLAWDETLDGPQPSVLIAPAFGGLSDFERARAEELAALGYVAIAVDYYGNGKRAGSPEEAQALMGTLQADRKILARRMVAACDAAKALPQVDAGRIGAMGYCLGGKAVLDLARTGADIRACAPLHGVYDRPNFETIIQDFVISYNSDPKRKGSFREINISHVILTINNILFGEHSVGDGLGNVFYMNKSFHRIINNIPKS